MRLRTGWIESMALRLMVGPEEVTLSSESEGRKEEKFVSADEEERAITILERV